MLDLSQFNNLILQFDDDNVNKIRKSQLNAHT